MARLSIWHDWQPPGTEPQYPALVPLFPVVSYTPDAPCPHGVLPDDTRLVCMRCHKTGAKTEARIAARAASEKRTGVNQPVDPGEPATIKFKAKGKARP